MDHQISSSISGENQFNWINLSKLTDLIFPGFKYDINENKSYEELSFDISNLEQIRNDSSPAYVGAGMPHILPK